jgi:glycosyltransferase involved in cell wall biosynthesis
VKITIVQGAFLPVPPLLGGAIEKMLFRLGQVFARRGHQVVHISRTFEGLPAEETIMGVRHIRIPGFNTVRPLIFLKLMDMAYTLRALRVLPAADIIISNTFWLPILSRDPLRGRIYVHVARFPKGQMRFYHNAARIQALSRAIEKAIIDQDPRIKDKVLVIPNFVEKKISDAEIKELFERREKKILYVGRIHPEKGIGLLIDAFRQLAGSGFSGWRLELVGPWQIRSGGGGDNYLACLQKKAEDIREHVDWVGPIFSDKELAARYMKASLFVYPSLAEKGEAFGVAPLEAMSCGCPVLVSGLECFKDYIKDRETGFIFDHWAKDPISALSRRMEEALESKELLFKIGENGYNKSSEYDIERVADMYLADFEKLTGQKTVA